MRERRNPARVAMDHLKTGLDLLHISMEHLPDPKGDGCDSMARCTHCDPTCAGVHALRSAEHWVSEGIKRMEAVKQAERLQRLSEGWVEEAREFEKGGD